MKKLLLLLFFGLTVYAQPNIGEPLDIVVCDQDEYTMNGGTFVDLTINNSIALNGLNPNEYYISYYETEQYAVNGTNAIENPEATYVINGQSVVVKVVQISQPANFAIAYFSIVINSPATLTQIPPFVINDIDGVPNNITVFDLTQFELQIVTPFAILENINFTYYESLTDAESETNAISDPYNYTITNQTVFFRVTTIASCFSIGSYSVTVQNDAPKPTGETTQTFTEGETLANLEVEGENIQWYAAETEGSPLNIETLLVDGTTYYTSQTVNNVESTQRLGVTVTKVLGLGNTIIKGLSYYPNPVKNIFTITNPVAVDMVNVYNALGQLVLTTAINSTEGTIDFSAFNNGIYFIKVTAGKDQQTIKIVKQ